MGSGVMDKQCFAELVGMIEHCPGINKCESENCKVEEVEDSPLDHGYWEKGDY
jgi:hypothetical protein